MIGDLVKSGYYCVDNLGIVVETDGHMIKVLWANNQEPQWTYFTNLEEYNEVDS